MFQSLEEEGVQGEEKPPPGRDFHLFVLRFNNSKVNLNIPKQEMNIPNKTT
jgi:hypothetical protein